MGRLNREQGQLFYSFCLDDAVPHDHRVRDGVLNLSWAHAELAPKRKPATLLGAEPGIDRHRSEVGSRQAPATQEKTGRAADNQCEANDLSAVHQLVSEAPNLANRDPGG